MIILYILIFNLIQMNELTNLFIIVVLLVAYMHVSMYLFKKYNPDIKLHRDRIFVFPWKWIKTFILFITTIFIPFALIVYFLIFWILHILITPPIELIVKPVQPDKIVHLSAFEKEQTKKELLVNYLIKYNGELIEKWYYVKSLNEEETSINDDLLNNLKEWLWNYIFESMEYDNTTIKNYSVEFPNLKIMEKQGLNAWILYGIELSDKNNLCWYIPPVTELEINNLMPDLWEKSEIYKNLWLLEDKFADDVMAMVNYWNDVNKQYFNIDEKYEYFEPVKCN